MVFQLFFNWTNVKIKTVKTIVLTFLMMKKLPLTTYVFDICH